jgi:hypothetical protein
MEGGESTLCNNSQTVLVNTKMGKDYLQGPMPVLVEGSGRLLQRFRFLIAVARQETGFLLGLKVI